MQILTHSSNQMPLLPTPPLLTCMHLIVIQAPPYMQHALAALERMLQGGQAWRSDLGGLEVLGGRRSHFLPDEEPGGKSSRQGWGRWSQQKGIPRMLSFNLESASCTHYISLSLAVLLLACSVFFLIWLYLTTSWVFCFRAIGEEGFQMDAGRLKMQNDRPIFLTFRYTACMSLCVFIVARAEKGEQECIMRVFVKQNRE